jgi:prepilin-type N-terminal cleavage/methylation domain-containing protein
MAANRGKTQAGFSLIELAVVLVVVGFLLGGLLIPLSSQIGQRNRESTAHQLDQVREALLGFALTNGYLPCPMDPDTSKAQANPSNAAYGEESRTGGACTKSAGILPWKTLGLSSGTDAWGHARLNQSDPWLGFLRYVVDPNFSNSAAPFTLMTKPTTSASFPLNVVDSNGTTPLTSAGEPPVVLVYSTGAENADDSANGLRADGKNETDDPDNPSAAPTATYEGGTPSAKFDDMTIWIARPVLFNRMVAAGRLP